MGITCHAGDPGSIPVGVAWLKDLFTLFYFMKKVSLPDTEYFKKPVQLPDM